MATTEPQKWAATLGNTADVNALPATTPSGSGRASFSGLFPPVTQRRYCTGAWGFQRVIQILGRVHLLCYAGRRVHVCDDV